MKQNVGTIVGDEIMLCQYHGIPYVPRANTTQNELLGIQPNMPLQEGEFPKTRWWGVGMGGHKLTAAANGKPKISTVKHEPTDGGCYELMPLVARLESQDLTEDERKQYALRKRIEHEGKNLVLYYLKALDLTKTKTELFKINVENGVTTSLPFVPSTTNLKPTPPTVVPNQVVPSLADGNYTKSVAKTTIPMTEKDILEYRNACALLLGDEELAVISEVMLVAGVVRRVNVPGPGGGQISFDECCVATAMHFTSTYENLNFADAAFDMVIQVSTTRSLRSGL